MEGEEDESQTRGSLLLGYLLNFGELDIKQDTDVLTVTTASSALLQYSMLGEYESYFFSSQYCRSRAASSGIDQSDCALSLAP